MWLEIIQRCPYIWDRQYNIVRMSPNIMTVSILMSSANCAYIWRQSVIQYHIVGIFPNIRTVCILICNPKFPNMWGLSVIQYYIVRMSRNIRVHVLTYIPNLPYIWDQTRNRKNVCTLTFTQTTQTVLVFFRVPLYIRTNPK